MNMLVPLDGSALAEAALAPALALLERAAPPRALILSRVVADTLTIPDVSATNLALDETDQALAYLHTIPVPTEGVAVTRKVGLGHAATVIAAQAEAAQADLIVMTTHGRTGLARIALGSVAEGVVQHATVPVLLVRADQATYLTRDNTTMRVLVPLDGTPAAENILAVVRAVLPGWLGEIALLRCVSASAPGSVLEESKAHLLAVAVRLQDQAPHVNVTCETIVGDPPKVIPRYSQEHAMDVIALTHRHQAIAERLFAAGGTVAACLAHTTLPLLIQAIPTSPPAHTS